MKPLSGTVAKHWAPGAPPVMGTRARVGIVRPISGFTAAASRSASLSLFPGLFPSHSKAGKSGQALLSGTAFLKTTSWKRRGDNSYPHALLAKEGFTQGTADFTVSASQFETKTSWSMSARAPCAARESLAVLKANIFRTIFFSAS